MREKAFKAALARRMAIATMLAVSSASATAFDFKGLVLGAATTSSEVDSHLNTGCKSAIEGRACLEGEKVLYEAGRVQCGAGVDGMTVCNGYTTILGSSARINVVINSKDTLDRIWLTDIEAANFEAIRQQLVAKFDAPKSTATPTVGFGATFRQTEVTWANTAQDEVALLRYAGDVIHSSLLFTTAEDRVRLWGLPKKAKGDI